MKLSRLAMWVAVFALIGGIAISSDMDIQALQAKLAAQEARLNDLQAKMNSKSGASEATGVVSIRKNAVVSIGGQVNTRYFYHNAKFTAGANNAVAAVPDIKESASDFKVSDAKINFKIDVNDYFDAFVRINLQNAGRTAGRWAAAYGNGDSVGVAQYAWIRWKNICNSGFGVLIGRNDLVFGSGDPAGMIEQGWDKNNIFWSDRWNEMSNANPAFAGASVAANAANPGIWTDTMNRIAWDHSRTTQITPYWEGWDKKLKVELSLFQDWDAFDGSRYWDANDRTYTSQNYGTGISGRVRFTPIEKLNFYLSGINRFSAPGNGAPGFRDSHHETGFNIGFDWVPCFFPRLKVFANWTHTWEAGFNRGVLNQGAPLGTSVDADVIHAGVLYNLTEQMKFVLQGDYMRSKADNNWGKIEGWGIYPALRYTLPYGVNFEVGYRYDYLKEKVSGDKFKVHTAYGQVGFDF